eukprot:m.69949 g.69949  ORF g.69949 m.69949 type:complete len:534 (-) comp16807_c0_seq1:51-1652(-)
MVHGGGAVLNDDEEQELLVQADADAASSSRFVILLTCFAALSGFLFGYDTGVVSGAMLLLKDEFNLNNWQQELVVSITIAGAIVGAVMGAKLNDDFGRRRIIVVSACIFVVGAVLLAFSHGLGTLLAGRAVLGLAIGLSSMTIPVYLAETAPVHIRGRLLTVNVLFITGGQFIAGIVDGGFSYVDDGWRYMLGLAAVPAVLQLCGFVCLPETPRWLVSKGRVSEAESVLRQIRSRSDVSVELQAIQRSFERSQETKVDVWRDLRTQPHLRRALLVGGSLQAFQQLVGINTVMYYSATIVKQGGVHDNHTAIWAAAGIAFLNFVFTLVGTYFVEVAGRRKLLLSSLTGVILALVLLAVCFRINAHEAPDTVGTPGCGYDRCTACVKSDSCGFCGRDPVYGSDACVAGNSSSALSPCTSNYAYDYCPTDYAWLTIVALCLYIVCFAPGMGPVPWTCNGELYPSAYRAFGNGFATAMNWIFNLLVSMTFLDLGEWITEAGAFFLYAGIAVIAWLFFFWKLPETKGVPLEDIPKLFI